MMDERSKKLSKIIAFLMLIALVGIFFILYEKVFKIPNPLEMSSEELKEQTDNLTLKIDSNDIQSLYSRLMGKTYNNGYSFDRELKTNDTMFQTAKVTINEISNQGKLQTALWYLIEVNNSGTTNVNCAQKNHYENRFADYYGKEENFICGSKLLEDPALTEEEKKEIDPDDLYYLNAPNKVEKVSRYIVSRVSIDDTLKYLFGNDVKWDSEQIETTSYICDLESDYMCLKTFNEKEVDSISNTEIIKATDHQTYITVESYYVYYDKTKGYLCQDTACNSVIDDNFNNASCELKGECGTNTCQVGEKCFDFELLKETYPDKIPTYIHTFSNTEKGDYYWVSSELKN